jgi:hypothetical protein
MERLELALLYNVMAKVSKGVLYFSQVPYLPGWYLWRRFNDMGWWETVYLGKAGKQKTSSLHTRLYDEFREECIAFWSEVYGRKPMVKQHKKLYDRKGHISIVENQFQAGTKISTRS